MDGSNHYDTFTSRWTAPDPLGDKGDPAHQKQKGRANPWVRPALNVRKSD